VVSEHSAVRHPSGTQVDKRVKIVYNYLLRIPRHCVLLLDSPGPLLMRNGAQLFVIEGTGGVRGNVDEI